MKFIITERQYEEFMNEQHGCLLPEGSFADSIRKEMISDFFKGVEEDSEYNEEEPEYDGLLDPHMGYEYQTYIQNDLRNGRFIYYEGFSSYCWKSFMKQKQYQGMGKEDIIQSFVINRGSKLGEEFNFNLVNYSFDVYDIGDLSDYVLVMEFSNM